jgi:hypothetical protein
VIIGDEADFFRIGEKQIGMLAEEAPHDGGSAATGAADENGI